MMSLASEQHPNNKVVLALHDLEHPSMLALLARDLGQNVHAVSLSMRLARIRGMSEVVAKFGKLGVNRIFIDESFGVQDTDLVLDLAAEHPQIQYITIDGTIGVKAMTALVEQKNKRAASRSTKLIATTDLPEIPAADIERTFRQTVPELVANLSRQAQESGMDGFYSSLKDVGNAPPDFFWVASGVRLEQFPHDDKLRTATIAESAAYGAQPDLYMIGSAVTRFYEYQDCITAFDRVIQELDRLQVVDNND